MYAVIYEPDAENDLVEIILHDVEEGGFALGGDNTKSNRNTSIIAQKYAVPEYRKYAYQ